MGITVFHCPSVYSYCYRLFLPRCIHNRMAGNYNRAVLVSRIVILRSRPLEVPRAKCTCMDLQHLLCNPFRTHRIQHDLSAALLPVLISLLLKLNFLLNTINVIFPLPAPGPLVRGAMPRRQLKRTAGILKIHTNGIDNCIS